MVINWFNYCLFCNNFVVSRNRYKLVVNFVNFDVVVIFIGENFMAIVEMY